MKHLKDGSESSTSQPKNEPRVLVPGPEYRGRTLRPQVQVDPRDLEVILRAGCLIEGKLGDLIHLRDETVGKDARFHVIYWRNASVHLYVVTEDDYLLLKKIKEGLEK